MKNSDDPSKIVPTPWLLAFGLFFTVVFLVNGALIFYANTTWNGLSTKDHYQKGLTFNQILTAQSAQDAMGWQARLHTAEEKGVAKLVLSLQDRQNQPVKAHRVSGVLFRPVQEGMDQTFTMTENEPGTYTALVAFPLPGWWEARFSASGAGTTEFLYVERIRLGVPSPTGR